MEISTRIYTLNRLKEVSIESFDAIYLGDPFAPQYKGNLCYDFSDLETALQLLKDGGKRVYISTFSVPRNEDLPAIINLFNYIKERGLSPDGIEVHNAGIIKPARNLLPEIPLHMGCLSNIYTNSTVELFRDMGAVRFACSYELSLNELEEIKNTSGVEIELLIHGRMVLGVSEECPVKWWIDEPMSQEEICTKPIDLNSDKMQLTIRGRTTLSGQDVCMLEHLEELLNRGFDFFHIDTSLMTREEFEAVSNIYKKTFEELSSNKVCNNNTESLKVDIKESLNTLKQYTSAGFCNGYYFKTSGSQYVGQKI